MDPAWSWLERDGKGVFVQENVAVLDTCVNMTRQRGINIIMVLRGTPGWANGNAGLTTPPSNPADFQAYAQWMAARYAGKVAAYEIWNEPNNSTFYSGTMAQYMGLLKAGHDGVKAGDGGATVLLGGVMYNDDAWIRDVYSRGGKPYFDGVATHPYQTNGTLAPEQEDFAKLPAVRQVMLDYGDSAKRIWITEFGWSAHTNASGTQAWALGVSEATQADYGIRAIKYAAANWSYVAVMIWFKERSWNNPSSDPEWFRVHIEGYGLLRVDRSERPIYGALRSYLTGS